MSFYSAMMHFRVERLFSSWPSFWIFWQCKFSSWNNTQRQHSNTVIVSLTVHQWWCVSCMSLARPRWHWPSKSTHNITASYSCRWNILHQVWTLNSQYKLRDPEIHKHNRQRCYVVTLTMTYLNKKVNSRWMDINCIYPYSLHYKPIHYVFRLLHCFLHTATSLLSLSSWLSTCDSS